MFNTKNTYDVIKKSEVRKVHPAVWQHPVIFGKVHNELCRFKCKLSNTGATWSSSDPSIVSVDSNREQWDLSGDIIDCFRRYSSELSPEEQEEIIKGVEEGLTDQDVKRYFTLVGAEKMRQYRRVLIARKKKG